MKVFDGWSRTKMNRFDSGPFDSSLCREHIEKRPVNVNLRNQFLALCGLGIALLAIGLIGK